MDSRILGNDKFVVTRFTDEFDLHQKNSEATESPPFGEYDPLIQSAITGIEGTLTILNSCNFFPERRNSLRRLVF